MWLAGIASNVVLAILLALVAWLVQYRFERPGLARVLWILVLVKLVTPPMLTLPLVEVPATLACKLGVCHCAHEGVLPTVVRSLPWVLLCIWSAGVIAMLLIAWRRWNAFGQVIAHARPAPPEWQALAERFCRELALRNTPEILTVVGRFSPMVVPGGVRARVLLPRDMLAQFSTAQRQALLLHELVHLRRGDHLVRLLELCIGIVFWWLPGVGSVGRQLRACEESCCDASVVSRLPEARRDYARLLLDVIDFADPLPREALPQATALSPADNLEQRLRKILRPTAAPGRTWLAALPLCVACAVLPCGLHYEFATGESLSPPVARPVASEATQNTVRWVGCDPPSTLPIYVCPN